MLLNDARVRFGPSMEGRVVRLWFCDDTIALGRILRVDDPDHGDRFSFDVVREDGKKPGSAFAKPAVSETFDRLAKYEVLEG
jgi:hypothetical protein